MIARPVGSAHVPGRPIDAAPAPETAPHRMAAGLHEYSVDVVGDEVALSAIGREWNEAVDRAGVPHPFLTHEWVRTWWECFGAGARLHVLVVRRGGRLAAIAPLMRDATAIYGVPVRRIRFMQNDHTPRTDILAAGDPHGCWRAIWSVLQRDREGWDVLQLNQLERSSQSATILADLARSDGHPVGLWRSGDSPYLPLEGAWEGYVNALSAKFRSNLRNRLARLTRIGEPSLEVLTDAAAIEAACGDAWRLEASGWKREAGTAIACDPAVHRFYTDLVPRAARAGWMRLLFLKAGERRIATSYGACYRNRLLLFKTGYDPEYATCAPFKLLTWFAVRRAYEEGLEEIDFLGDAEPWKLEWTSATRGHDWVFVFARSIRARLLHSVKFEWGAELKRWRA